MAETRLQAPGGWMTPQDLRDLVGWAGSAGASGLRAGDAQDWLLERPRSPNPVPGRFALRTAGSVQSSAFGAFPDPVRPWLTTGVWMDLLEQVGDPGSLDVQLVHDPVQSAIPRMGHLRFTARKEAHQWDLRVRRPGSTVVLRPGSDTVDTGSIPALVHRTAADWAQGRDQGLRGLPEPVVPGPGLAEGALEGFREEAAGGASFGLWMPRGFFRLEHLRDLAWIAADAGAHRLWLTPGRVLLVPGLRPEGRRVLEDWTAKIGWAGRHSDLDHAVRTVGLSAGAQAARDEVAEYCRQVDRSPTGRGLLVADEAFNRADGVVGVGVAVVLKTSGSWLFRSADGSRSGEGSLEVVLESLGRAYPPGAPPGAPPPANLPEAALPGGAHRCEACLTVYDPQWGDPLGSVAPGTAFADLEPAWVCPVCGGPAAGFHPARLQTPINLNLFA